MKVVSSDGLTKLVQLIKGAFIPVSNVVEVTEIDTETASEVTLATVATTGAYSDLSGKPITPTKTSDLTNDSGFVSESYVSTAISGKQDTLVSGTNIKTINNTSILGSGNITISGSGGSSVIFRDWSVS